MSNSEWGIVMQGHNTGKFASDAMWSLFNQLLSDFEVVLNHNPRVFGPHQSNNKIIN